MKLYPDELIGKEITVVEAKNPANLGLHGKVIDETKSTLKIETQGQVRTLFKKDIVLKINNQLIKGVELQKRPEDRIKGR